MNSNQYEDRETVQHLEKLKCDRCRKKWEVGWVEGLEGRSIEHTITCDCGHVMKVIQATEDDSPLVILQHSHLKTILACLPAFVAGAFFPVLSDQVILTAYVISWIGCAATFVNKYNRSASALGGIAIWSIMIVSGAAAVGALAAHALWWWWQ